MMPIHRKWRSFLFRVRYVLEMIRDRLRGVDFTAPVSKQEAGTETHADALYYASSGYIPEIRMALDYLKITSTDAILDYGSGKGAVFEKFAKYPFRRIAGIELSESLASVCKNNIRRLKLAKVELFVADAVKFKDINDFNFFYFFNPFAGEVFEAVINNIIESAASRPREVTLIYYHPKCHEILMKTNRFKIDKSFVDGARRLNIYKLI